VLVENRPGVMDRLGLGYALLSALDPRSVYGAITGYGQTGPLRDKPSFDAITQAMTAVIRPRRDTVRWLGCIGLIVARLL
jgi:crotonobetainyl-CoA:carnitine CoA-transferase CaiB-like acyl-CoA transferase